MKVLRLWPETLLALLLLAGVLWLRWPGLGFSLWNVDEAIHAAAARTLLDGGVLYRDAVDQRTPLTYYAVAGVFSIFGENNLWALRVFVAALIAATAFGLHRIGRFLGGTVAGVLAAFLYALLSSSALYQGDANALCTEWFVALFSTLATVAWFCGGADRTFGRIFATGLLFGCSFLSKQPALLDLAAPLSAVAYLGLRQSLSRRALIEQMVALATGWATPVLLTLGYLALHGALADGIFYAWTYNLRYYGPEIVPGDRFATALTPFQLIGSVAPWTLVLWLGGACVVGHRLMQRQPAPHETAGNPGLVYLAAWSAAALAGAASGGRGYDHYSIQFLAPWCLGGGLALGWLLKRAGASPRRWPRTVLGLLVVALLAAEVFSSALVARRRTLPEDPSLRISAYIREHSGTNDRIFVWGYHPDIYLFADRRPASRFLYASFVTGLIPWTNTAPERDTRYAIVPGTLETLLRDLAARPPVFFVDCSAGPNRHWQKYPLGKFPALEDYVRRHYKIVEADQFVPQGFRLFKRLAPGETIADATAAPPLATEVASSLTLSTLATPLAPLRASAPHGANRSMIDGRLEYFAHAPSTLLYRVPEGPLALRGGFGLRPAAYAADNPAPTDGAEFIIRWRTPSGGEQVLLRRLLRPREEPADRGLQSFRVELPRGSGGGELELTITAGATGNPASDWTYWTDLYLENFR